MEIDTLLSTLNTHYKALDCQIILRALRQDQLVWKMITDPGLNDLQVNPSRANPLAIWLPGDIAYFAITHETRSESLNDVSFALGADVRKRAAQTYEAIFNTGLPPSDLAQAGLLALALRERRRLKGSWQGTLLDLLIKKNPTDFSILSSIWKTPFACLYNYVTDFPQLVREIFSADYIELSLAFVPVIIHAVLCTPQEDEKTLAAIFELFSPFALSLQIASLECLNDFNRSETTQKLALEYLKYPPTINYFTKTLVFIEKNQEGLTALPSSHESAQIINDLSLLATFYRHAGKNQKCSELLELSSKVIDGLKGEVVQNLAQSYHSSGKVDQAYQTFQDSIVKNPEANNLKVDFIYTLIDDGELDLAFKLIETAPNLQLFTWLKPFLTSEIEQTEIDPAIVTEVLQSIDAWQNSKHNDWADDIQTGWLVRVIQKLLNQQHFHHAWRILEKAFDFTPNDLSLIQCAAELHQKWGKINQAIQYARMAAFLSPASMEKQRVLAYLLLQSEQWQDAFKQFKALIRLQQMPESEDLLAFALSAVKTDQPEISLSICQNIIVENPQSARAYTIQAESYILMGNDEDARKSYLKAIEISPFEVENWQALVNLALEHDKISEAEKTLQKAIEANPTHDRFHLLMGKVLGKSNRQTESLESFKQAYALNPDSSENLSALINQQIQCKNHDQAHQLILENLDKVAESADLSAKAGVLLLERGDKHKALPLFSKALSAHINHLPLIKYALLLLEAKEQPQAFNLTKKQVEADLVNLEKSLDAEIAVENPAPEALVALAKIKQALKAYEESLKLFARASIHISPVNIALYGEVQYGLGFSALQCGKIEIGLAALKEAAANQPANPHIHQALAEAYLVADLHHEAEKTARNSLSLCPDNLQTLLWYAHFMHSLNQHSEAIKALNEALFIAPDRADILLHLAKIHYEQNQPANTAAILKRILEQPSTSAEDLHQAGLLQVGLNELDSALDFFTSALQKAEPTTPALLLDLMRLYHMLDRYDDEFSLAEIYQSEFADDYRLLTLKADALTNTQQYEAALDCLSKALILQSSNDEDASGDEPYQSALVPAGEFDKTALLYRQAQLMRLNGQYEKSYLIAEQTTTLAPDNLEYLKLAVENAYTLMHFEQAKQLLQNPTYLKQLEHPKQVAILASLASIQVEIAIHEADISLASKICGKIADQCQHSPRIFALQAQLAHHFGETKIAHEYLKQAQDLFNLMYEKTLPGENAIMEKYDQTWHIYAIAMTELALSLWKPALEDFQRSTSLIPINPLQNLRLAQTHVILAEQQKLAQLLGITAHAPGSEQLSEANYHAFEDQMLLAKRFFTTPEIEKWLLRGRITFGKEVQAQDYQKWIHTPNDLAFYISHTKEQININELMSLLPEDETVLQAAALRLMETDPHHAQQLIQRAIQKDTTNPINHAIYAWLSQDDLEFANKSMETALNFWANEREWHIFTAKNYIKLDRLTPAARHIELALELQPENAAYWALLAQIKAKKNELNAAKEMYAKSVSLTPENAQVMLAYSQVLQKTGNHKEALKVIEKALEFQPLNIHLSQVQASLLFETGDVTQAIKKAEEILGLDPGNQQALVTYIRALDKGNQHEKALDVLEKAIKENPENLVFILEKIRLIRENDGVEMVLPHLRLYSKQFPENTAILSLLTAALIETKKYQEAQETAQISLQLDPEQPEIHLCIGQLLRAKGQLDQCIDHLSKAIALKPDYLEAYLELGKSFLDRREIAKAIDIFKQAAQISPVDYRPYYMAGLALKDCKDYKGAETMLKQAANHAPNDTNIHRQLGAIVALNLVRDLQEG